MRLKIDVVLDYDLDGAADTLLLVEAAGMPDQIIVSQDLWVSSLEPLRATVGSEGVGQRCWAYAENRLKVNYTATVEIDRPDVPLASLAETPPRMLPAETVNYLLPSRYCESDQFEGFLAQEFPNLRGGPLAAALLDWVGGHLTYQSGSSTGVTTALMTFANRHGVCRDYAHLLVALARAGGIPARCVSAYAPGVDPPDFHAVAQFWLEGAWRLADATGMAKPGELAVVAVGHDATDIAFMTTFGAAILNEQTVTVTREIV
ncbi:transglutaminase-like domain-containing protein [Sphingomonas immobilis]|uniref:Transglutaminase family protein n=1 Tax=Sphingomonas immobilis TaxID=3063997 RepID=A0ABT9A278_9SPHN|nr:transglutaminase family protein [Sphingomonas sp. CA1-15]MDO7843648.1 transglutaminase family protein [Sphingomonas sp. CA1-15]